jgi:hypothetical protein
MKTYNSIQETPHLAGVGIKRLPWDKTDVIAEYDSNWNLTLQQLANMSGWSVQELKELLMS